MGVPNSDGIWQRWVAYTKNGHGANKELRNLLKNKAQEATYSFHTVYQGGLFFSFLLLIP